MTSDSRGVAIRPHQTSRWALGLALFSAACASARGRTTADPSPLDLYGLTHAALLTALDSSLAVVRTEAWIIHVHGPGKVSPFSKSELRDRGIAWRADLSACPGEATLDLQPPRRLPDGRIVLDVFEMVGSRGLAGGHSYVFRCHDAGCVLADAIPNNADVIVACSR